ncbi:MAG: hypothetical protein IPF92_22075 [Myxococcales bacterium]|nr:hypothetical protein [Myxococcales bacterium]
MAGALLLGLAAATAGCPGGDQGAPTPSPGSEEAGADAADVSTPDARDASAPDVAPTDASVPEVAPADTGVPDAPDAAPADGGTGCGSAPAAALPSTAHDATWWQPEGAVHALAWSDDSSKLVVGGTFASVRSPDGASTTSVTNLAVLDATTGQPIPGYPAVVGDIADISVSGDTAYVVGDVTQVNGAVRTRGFAFSLSSKALAAWAPTFAGTPPYSPSVKLVRATAGGVFVGGYFTAVGGSARFNVAALDGATGSATAWAPPALGVGAAHEVSVRALAIASDRVFVGGDIDVTGGDGVRRRRIAALDLTSGAVLPWSPSVPAGDSVYAIEVSRDLVAIGTPQSGLLSVPSMIVADARSGAVCWQASLANAQGFYRLGVARGVVFGGGLTGTLFTAGSAYKAFALSGGAPLGWGADLYAQDGSAATVEDLAVAPNGTLAISGNRVGKGGVGTPAPKLMVYRP